MNFVAPPNDESYQPFTQSEVATSIPEVFERRTQGLGQRIAIQTQERSYTYTSLKTAANRIAHALLEQLGDGSDPIAILLNDTSEAVAAILGILKAGKIYLPLDVSLALPRLRYLIEDSRARLLLTDTRTLTLARELIANTALPILNLDRLPTGALPGEFPTTNTPDRLAALLYTSGSTAQPKGVMHSHRTLLHLTMRYTNLHRVTQHDRIALLRTLTVIGGSTHSLGTLLNGAALFPLNLKQHGILNLLDWLRTNQISMCSFGPTLIRIIAGNATDTEPLPALREVTLSGEPVYKTDIDICKRLFSPACVLVNSLGATEAPFAAYFRIDPDTKIQGDLVPVGHPPSDLTIVLRDEHGDAVTDGTPGEIVVQSRYIALGYWNNPHLTHAKFSPSPDSAEERLYRTGDLGRLMPDGTLVHLGRKDDIVKIRGYRVGLVEIEAALMQHPGVKQVAVTSFAETDGDNYLAAYVVPGDERRPTVHELTAFLQSRLPDFMVPAQFVFMTALPQINNKIDRQALPRIARGHRDAGQAYDAPRNGIEAALCEVWEEVLEIAPIGVNEQFLLLGGDSLKATQIVSRLQQRFGWKIGLADFFKVATIAGLGEVILVDQGTA